VTTDVLPQADAEAACQIAALLEIESR